MSAATRVQTQTWSPLYFSENVDPMNTNLWMNIESPFNFLLPYIIFYKVFIHIQTDVLLILMCCSN